MTSTAHKNKDGDLEWRNEQGDLHRENGPAIEYVSGKKEWWLNGEIHRENGPAIEWADGAKEWWFRGRRHRENGPAIEYTDGEKHWYVNGSRHRENGPAVEYPDGAVEYWLNRQNKPEIEQKVKENMARIQQQKLLDLLSKDDEVSAKMNTSSPKISKKL